jgi:hypothetical protein
LNSVDNDRALQSFRRQPGFAALEAGGGGGGTRRLTSLLLVSYITHSIRKTASSAANRMNAMGRALSMRRQRRGRRDGCGTCTKKNGGLFARRLMIVKARAEARS